ncbi:MAG: efflux RND transporter periplasmic adaptor subunit [Candidatus Riflebacteria bacterium]|nr:efflux RND transporter periplasmic adaptor subunit [Candidatus Riflebacteria bacterium]
MKFNRIEKKTLLVPALAVFLAGIIAGYFFFANDMTTTDPAVKAGHQEHKAETWTCSMHPQIRKPSAGKCPICFMDLILLNQSTDSGAPNVLTLSETAQELAEVRTTEVFSGLATQTIRLPGTVKLDETRVKHVTAWVGGRIEKLYVNYTGIPVRQGDHMAEFYSPDLIAAQEELIRSAGNDSLHKAVIERLLRWGISAQQIEMFNAKKSPSELVTINSPSAGIVIEQAVKEGMYVNQGTRMFSIADVNHLWLIASVYERDIQWLRYGQAVECEFEAFPGKIFPGTISFISPILSGETRTVDARINIENSNGLLKPGMFGRVTIKVSIGSNGEVISPAMAGKWISPMHPEVIKDGPGQCDVCGMDLVPIESMGVKTASNGKLPLIIPESAVLWSGPRSLVFREIVGEKGAYETVEVLVGSRVDSGYLVYSGLEKGDRVVVEGAFKIDSEQQIRGQNSMMSPHRDTSAPKAPETPGEELSEENLRIVETLVKDCLVISEKLAEDDLEATVAAATKAHEQLPGLKKASVKSLSLVADQLMPILMKLAADKDIKMAREELFKLTAVLKNLIIMVDGKLSFAVQENFCPMAFDNKGAIWLQSAPQLANPYFGKMMLKCGSTKKIWNKEIK